MIVEIDRDRRREKKRYITFIIYGTFNQKHTFISVHYANLINYAYNFSTLYLQLETVKSVTLEAIEIIKS